MTRQIALSQGKVALVDDDDYEWLSQWRWSCKPSGRVFYAVRRLRLSEQRGQRQVLMHREILHAPRGVLVDHIDYDGLHNWRGNLRLCNRMQNAHHQRKVTKPTSSQFRGVSWRGDTRQWAAEIKSGGSRYRLGQFTDEVDAALAYNAAALFHHGEFAHVNALPG